MTGDELGSNETPGRTASCRRSCHASASGSSTRWRAARTRWGWPRAFAPH